jgi:hypothetical protein
MKNIQVTVTVVRYSYAALCAVVINQSVLTYGARKRCERRQTGIYNFFERRGYGFM